MTKPLVLKPHALSIHMGEAFGNEKPVLVPDFGKTKVKGQSWDALNDLSKEINLGIVEMAANLAETVELVNAYGCRHMKEYTLVVKRTNEDLEKFTDDYLKILDRHEGRRGMVKDEDDNALLLSVFEDYRSFTALFQGTMTHTSIALTEYALEAQELVKERQALEANQEQPVDKEVEAND